MANMIQDAWGVVKGADSGVNALDAANKALGLEQLDRIGTGFGRSGLGTLGKKEQAELEAKKLEQAGLKAASEAVSMFKNNPDYANASVQRRGQIISDYLKNQLPAFMKSKDSYVTNPNLAETVRSSVETALTALHSDDLKKLNDASFYDYIKRVGKSGLEQQSLRSAVTAAVTEDSLKYQDEEIQRQASELRNLYDGQLAELKANAQAVAEDPVLSENYKKQIEQTQAKYDEAMMSLLKSKKYNQENHERNEQQAALDILDSYEKFQQGERTRIEEDPLYREVLVRQGELSEEAKARNEALWLGLKDNDYKKATIAKYFVENLPDLAGAVSLGIVSAPAGAAGTSLALASYNLATVFGQVGQQVLGDIMDADLAHLEKSDDYRAIRDGLLKSGKDAKQADSLARVQLAIRALRDQDGKAYIPAALTGLLGPEALLLKSGLATRLLNNGIIKRNIATRAMGGLALESLSEGGEEVYENAVAINLANKALGTDRSLFEDWQQNFGLGALLGGMLGAPGAVFATGSSKRSAKDMAQKQADEAAGVTGGTTRTTLSDTTTATPTEDISVKAETQTSAYSPEDEIKRQTVTAEARNTLGRIGDRWLHDNITYESVESMPEDELISVYEGLRTLEQSGKRGMELVDTWLRQIKANNQMDFSYDDIKQRAEEIIKARGESSAQPTTTTVETETEVTTEGETNGTDTGRRQGDTASAGEAADTRQTQATAAESTDTTVTAGDSSAAPSSGTGGITYEDAGTTAPNVPSDQPANGQTGQGTNGGRDNTADATVGTQPGAGTGSTAGSTEQRTGDGTGTEVNGTAEQTGTDVNPEEGIDTTADVIDETERNREDEQFVKELLNKGQEQYDEMYNTVYKQVLKLSFSPDAAALYTTLYMRLASTIAQIMNVEIDRALPIEFRSSRGKNFAGVTTFWPSTGRISIGITADGKLDATTLPHELTHAFIDRICYLSGKLKRAAANGNEQAAQFIKEFEDFAHALGMPTDEDVFNKDNWSKRRGVQGMLTERAAIAFENYIATGELPAQANMQDAIEGTGDFFRTFQAIYENTLKKAMFLVNEVRGLLDKIYNGEPLTLGDTKPHGAASYLVTYAIPQVQYATGAWSSQNPEQAKTILGMFDRMTSGFRDLTDNPVASESTQNYAYLNTAAIILTNDYIEQGMAPNVAYNRANERLAKAAELAYATPEQATDIRTKHEQETIQTTIREDSDITVLSTPEFANSDVVTTALTSDQDLIDISTGMNTPEVNSAEDVTNPMSGLGDMVGHNDPQVDGAPTVSIEAQSIVETVNEITQSIEDGAADPYVDPTTQPWFAEFSDGTVFTNEDGTPKQYYRNGFVLTEEPTGAEMEVQVYARSANTVKSIEDILGMGLEGDVRKSVIKAFNDFSRSVKAGEPVELSIDTREDLVDAGIYAFEVDGTVHLMDDYDASDTFEASHGVRSLYKETPKTEDAVAMSAAEVVLNNSQRFSQAVKKQVQNESLTDSSMMTAGMSAPQKAGAWQKWCTYMREFINSDAAFHTWDAMNFAQLIGEVSSALFRSWTMVRPKIQGANIELMEKIMNPIDAWIKHVAKQMGMDFDVVKQDLGRIRTDFHTLEAARKEEEDLRFEVTRASLIVDGEINPETGQYETAATIQQRAQDELDNYLAFQRGDIDPRTGEPIKRRVYGGRRVKDIEAELFDPKEGLVTKYGQNIVEQALGRFGKAFADATQYAIERGAISAEDVASFGEWAYFTPLNTKPEYENGDSSDVVAMYPKRLIRHRGGSFEPAVDGYTALQMLIKRTSNAVGSVELSRDTMGAYQKLKSLAISKDPNVEAHTVTLMPESQRYDSPAPLKITYYNGMAVTPYSSLMAHVNDNNEYARELDKKKSLVIRVLEPVFDKDGNRVSTQNRAYAVIFDDDHADVGKSFGAPFKYDKEAADRYRKSRKITSGFASLFTTYKPFFPPINAIRDFIERTYFSARRVFQDANGEAVYGEEVALRMQANMAYAPEVMKAVFTGKPEQVGGKVGEYLSEFKRQGIMTSASIRAMLQDMGNTNYAYIEKAIEDMEKGASVTETLDKLRRAGRGMFRLWAEMYYAIPTFAMYKSLRDSGVSEADAAFHVTEMMNLSARGRFHTDKGLVGMVGSLFPFVTSIGQTASQLANYFGLNVTTFGHSKSKQNAALAIKSWGYFAGSVAMCSTAIAAVATMLGDGDDEEGYRILDNMSLGSFTFMPIPVGDGKYFKFPLGFGPLVFAFQTAMGIDRVSRGVDTGAHVAMNLADSFYRNISPLGGPDFEVRSVEDFGKKLMMTCTPLLAQPIMQLAVDRNYFGTSIQRDRHIREGERRADINSRSTPKIWKDLAKGMADSIGVDMSPESVRHLVTGYMAGPLSGIVAAMESDALSRDPMYASTRAILGPVYTAIGAGSMFSSVGNRSTSRYWNELEFYNDLIKSAGVADLLKVKPGEKDAYGNRMTAYNKQYNTLLALGFGSDVASDYANIHLMEKELKKIDTDFKTRLDNAYKLNKSEEVIEEMYRGFAIRRNNYINSKLAQTNYYQGNVKRGTVQLPPRELIDAYRERMQ